MFQENLDVYFCFADEVVLYPGEEGQTTIKGHYGTNLVSAEVLDGLGLSQSAPQLLCKTTDVEGLELATPLQVVGKAYASGHVYPIDDGKMSIVELQK